MHPLLRQIRSVGHRAHRYLIYRGAAFAGCVTIAAIVASGLTDWWFRYHEQGMRWLSTIVVAMVGLWAFVRFLWPALVFRRREEAVAEWIERRFPDLRDRLSSAVAFASQPAEDGRYGSLELRQSLLDEMTREAADRDLSLCLDRRPIRRAFVSLAMAVTLIVVLLCVDIASSTLAARRLFMPWRAERWPRRTLLAFQNEVSKIAVGSDFVAEVIDQRGWLPSDVTIEYWFDSDNPDEIRRHTMTYAGGKMTHRLPQVTQPFRYRALGGDDRDMPWRHIEVVEPPRVVRSTVHIVPPEYSGLPATTSERAVHALAGSSIRIAGRSSKRLQTAELVVSTGTTKKNIPAELTSDRSGFEVPSASAGPWIINESGSYSWRLVDSDRVSASEDSDHDIDVVQDSPPTVILKSPLSDDLFTPMATVPLRISVHDDLAIRSLRIKLGENTTTLVERSSPPNSESNTVWPPAGEQMEIERSLAIQSLGELASGQSVKITLVASDFKSQEGSTEWTLTLISPEELRREIENRQTDLLRRLAELLRVQRTLADQTKKLHRELQDSADRYASAIGVTSALDLGQRRVREQITGDQGAIALLDQLLGFLSNNLWEDVQLDGHFRTVRQELRDVSDKLLPPVEQEVARATNLSTSTISSSTNLPPTEVLDELREALGNIATSQKAVIESLEAIVDRLGHWSGYRLLAQEVAEMRDEQSAIRDETLGLTSAARNLAELNNEEQRKLEATGRRQSDLAVRLSRFDRRMREMRQKLADDEAIAAATLDDAIAFIQTRSIVSAITDVARHLAENRIGSAVAEQRQIVDDLQQLYDVLSQRPEQSLARTSQQLRAAAAAAAELQERQNKIADEAGKLSTLPDAERREAFQRLAKQEEEIQAAVSEIERRLKRIASEQVSQALHSTSSSLRAAQTAAQAADERTMTEAARQAVEELGRISGLLNEQIQEIEKRQSEQESKWLLDSLVRLRAEQQSIADETETLTVQLKNTGKLEADAVEKLSRLASRQTGITNDANTVTQRLDDRRGLQHALRIVAESMADASARLKDHALDDSTRQSQHRALDRLRILIEAFESEPAEHPPSHDTQPNGKDDARRSQESKNSVILAELKYLKALQFEIQVRTQALAESRQGQSGFTETQQSELRQLANEQRELADILDAIRDSTSGDNSSLEVEPNEHKSNLGP